MSTATAATVRVLLADDTREIRRLLRLSLELDGRFEVVAEAADGSEAVELVDRHRPDVAVVDLSMPVLDGLQAIPLMRECSPETRVVVLSAFSGNQMGAQATDAGAIRYLEKGMAAAELVEAIAGVATEGAAPTVAAAGEEAEPDDPRVSLGALAPVIEQLTHETRSPLSIAAGFVVPLRAAVRAGDQIAAEACVDRIERNVGRVLRLVEVLLDARAIAGGTLELRPKRTDIGTLVRETVDDVASTSGRPWTCIVEGDATVVVDDTRVCQIVTNLVVNADKFAPPGTPIDVTVRSTPAGCEVVVRDHGPGVPPAEVDRLFRRFGRLERDRGVTGTGLGLFLSKEIAVAHGGDLVHAVPQDGVGSSFVLRLPEAPPEEG